MALGVVAVMTKGIIGICTCLRQMTVGVVAVMADDIRGCGSDDKRYKWHMHRNMAVGVVAVMTKEISGTCIRL